MTPDTDTPVPGDTPDTPQVLVLDSDADGILDVNTIQPEGGR